MMIGVKWRPAVAASQAQIVAMWNLNTKQQNGPGVRHGPRKQIEVTQPNGTVIVHPPSP